MAFVRSAARQAHRAGAAVRECVARRLFVHPGVPGDLAELEGDTSLDEYVRDSPVDSKPRSVALTGASGAGWASLACAGAPVYKCGSARTRRQGVLGPSPRPGPSPVKIRPFCLAVGLSTFSTIAVEIMLTRIYSVTMYYHFAFMVIALALLGLAIAGVAVYLLPSVFRRERAAWLCGLFILLFALSSAGALYAALQSPISLNRWQDDLGRLIIVYVAAGVPFLMSGFAVTIAIASARDAIGRVYAYDLVGAGIGCMCVVALLSALGAPGAILLMCALGAVASAVFALSHGATGTTRAGRYLAITAGAVAVVFVVLALTESSAHRFGNARNPGKFLGNREVLFERWNAFSQITVAPAGADDHRWIFIDADAATRMWSGTIADQGYEAPRRIPEVRVASLAYAIRNQGTALIIGPGGGTDVISALYHGAPRVVGVEINPIITDDIMRGAFAEYTGHLYEDPRVHIVADEGRSYIRRSGERYATIQATLVDTWAASSSGAFTLSENNIYTVEAFTEFLDRLEPDGVLTFTRWYDPGAPKEFLRLVAIGRAGLEAMGVPAHEVAGHFFLAADSERRATMLVNRAPFTPAETLALARKAKEGKLTILYTPHPVADEHRGIHAEAALVAAFLRADSADAFLGELPYDVSAPTDDRPFFFYTLLPGELFAMLANPAGVPLNNLGVIILLVLLLLSIGATVLFVLVPLVALRRDALREERGAKLRVLGYFLCLGLGFILVEIGLMQQFVLFLGHPVYSLAVVLASLLIASGVGSALSQRGSERWGTRGLVVRSVAALCVLLVVYAVVLTPLFHALLGLPLVARIAIAGAFIAVPGLLMGILLPSGVRTADALGAAVVPWAWGLNGAASVVGSIMATFVSMNLGFTMALIAGMLAYVVGTIALPPMPGTAQPDRTGAP